MTIGSHQSSIGKSQVHLTPRWILDPLGPFDLDPCASDPRPWDCAAANFTEADDGLARDWFGRVWLNPPFHRYRIAAWLDRMERHDRGIALVHARTETEWFGHIWRGAAALLFLAGRVVFCQTDGAPQIVSDPASKHFGKVANSGAPVVLAAFGPRDADVLAAEPLAGQFVPLIFARHVLGAALDQSDDGRSWRAIVADWLRHEAGPIAVADLYRAFADHPKSKANPNWKAKLRQTLQRGAGRSIGRDRWVAA